jgi:hypothetical protein
MTSKDDIAVDPYSVGCQTFGWIRIPDPENIISDPDPGSSGSEMNWKENYSDMLIKFYNFSTK